MKPKTPFFSKEISGEYKSQPKPIASTHMQLLDPMQILQSKIKKQYTIIHYPKSKLTPYLLIPHPHILDYAILLNLTQQ